MNTRYMRIVLYIAAPFVIKQRHFYHCRLRWRSLPLIGNYDYF